MTDPQPTQVLSVRISEGLRRRLENLRDLMSRRKRENVSTSEIAKQLLESISEERLELAELLAEPTKALLRIRKKGEAQQSLTLAEWTLLASYVQQGQESLNKNPISRESDIAILEAFLAAYKVRKRDLSDRESYYLGNLPIRGDDEAGEPTAETVRRAVTETIRQLQQPGNDWTPANSARNLFVFLDDGEARSTEALNQALRPFWRNLWRVAARGHYTSKRRPIREERKRGAGDYDYAYEPQIPSVSQGKYKLDFQRGEENEIFLLLNFPDPRGPMYPMSRYPMISEFRAMLNGLTADSRTWDGEYFLGYVARGKEAELWFRSQENGIAFGFTEDEWKTLRRLFARAWEMPELATLWDELAMEYGEL